MSRRPAGRATVATRRGGRTAGGESRDGAASPGGKTGRAACGPRHGRDAAGRAHRWGRTQGRIGFHGGKIEVERPRVRGVDGREVTIPSWETAAQGDWPRRRGGNTMVVN